MKTKSAVLVETGKPLELAEIEIPVLKSGQTIIEIVKSGVCHTQVLECRGYRGEDKYLPHCLGHEAGGIVQETGPDVKKVKPGDRVILSWIKGTGADVPGTVYKWNGMDVNAGAVTTFSRYSVVSENRLTVMPDSLSMKEAALMGCAIPTGVGVVFNTLSAAEGQSIAIFGTGGVGLCCVNAARIARCNPIIAIDLLDEKLELAKQVGATHCINAVSADPVDAIRSICVGGADLAIEAAGYPQVILQALHSVRNQGGTTAVVGNARYGETVQLDPLLLNQGKRILGTWGGDCLPDRDYPRYAELLAAGTLDIRQLISVTYSLDEINKAIDDLEAGSVVRPIIDMTEE